MRNTYCNNGRMMHRGGMGPRRGNGSTGRGMPVQQGYSRESARMEQPEEKPCPMPPSCPPACQEPCTPPTQPEECTCENSSGGTGSSSGSSSCPCQDSGNGGSGQTEPETGSQCTCQEQQQYTPTPNRYFLTPACQKSQQPITDNQGAPAQDDNNSLTVGPTGTMILKDAYYLEKMAHFDRERIPERVVHANGSGAFGYFKATASMAEYTKADLFSQAGKVTPVFARFSTVAGHKGSADTLRDPRGFAVKFYTDEGNLDIVGLNFPVFFIRDAINFPDLLHALKNAPDTGIKNQVRWWDFFSQMPEATNMVTYYYSDQGTVKSFRKMDGFGVNTYVWVNAQGQRFYVKYHFVSHLGVETIDRHEAMRLAGEDPDVAKRDLYDTLASGQTVSWDMAVQLLPICDASSLSFDPLDDTKLWPEDQFPLHKVGELVLNRNFENEFCQVEQAAFCPANLVPGIEFSDDKMLVGRVFSYTDTQRYRLGANYTELPINRPKSPVENYQQDGSMRMEFRKGTVNYSPSSCTLGCGPVQMPQTPPYTAQYSQGNQIRASLPHADDFTQAGEHFRSMSQPEQEHLADNIAVDLYPAPDYVVDKCIEHFTAACPQWGEMVRRLVDTYRMH